MARSACARPRQEAESKLRMVTSLWNVLDFLAIFPPLVELALLHGANVPFTLGRLDLRWFKILRRGRRSACHRLWASRLWGAPAHGSQGKHATHVAAHAPM